MFRGTRGSVFLFSWKRLGGGQQELIVSIKTVPEDLNMKCRSKCNHGFTDPDCFHCAILKAWKAWDMQFFLQNIQNEIFKIFKINATWNSPEQSVELPRKEAIVTKTPHSWYSYFVNIVGHYYGVIIEGLYPVELYFLKSLKVTCSNKTACSLSVRSIFSK